MNKLALKSLASLIRNSPHSLDPLELEGIGEIIERLIEASPRNLCTQCGVSTAEEVESDQKSVAHPIRGGSTMLRNK